MIVTPSPILNHFKHTLRNKKQSQAFIETPNFDEEVQKVQTRVNKIRSGEDKSPLEQTRLSWEDEEILHQFDDEPKASQSIAPERNVVYEPVSKPVKKYADFIDTEIKVDEKN